jgi:hypothetical protein
MDERTDQVQGGITTVNRIAGNKRHDTFKEAVNMRFDGHGIGVSKEEEAHLRTMMIGFCERTLDKSHVATERELTILSQVLGILLQ